MSKPLNQKPTLREYLTNMYGKTNLSKPYIVQRLESQYDEYLNDIVCTLESERQMGNWLVDCPREVLEFMARRGYWWTISMDEARIVCERSEPKPATEN